MADEDLKVSLNSHARVLDDYGFSSYACTCATSPTTADQTRYSLDLSRLKHLPDGYLLIRVHSVAF